MNSLREIHTAHGNLRQGIKPKTLLELSVVASIRARIEPRHQCSAVPQGG